MDPTFFVFCMYHAANDLKKDHFDGTMSLDLIVILMPLCDQSVTFWFQNFSVLKLFNFLDIFGFGMEKIGIGFDIGKSLYRKSFGFGFVQIFGIVTHCSLGDDGDVVFAQCTHITNLQGGVQGGASSFSSSQ